MSSRIILMMLGLTVGMVALVWYLNAMWARSFPGAAAPQHASRADQVASRKQIRAEHDAKEKAKLESEKYSAETLKAAAHTDGPRPLTPAEFNPATGQVEWPKVLLAEDYDRLRKQLDHLLEQRAAEPADAEHTKKAHADAEELLALLKTHIRELPTKDYLAAHHFLDSLIYALRP